jgi:hypothetical protein
MYSRFLLIDTYLDPSCPRIHGINQRRSPTHSCNARHLQDRLSHVCVGKRSTKDGASPAFIAHLHSQVKVGRPFCCFVMNFSALSCLVIWQGTNISTPTESAQALWKCSSPLNKQIRTREPIAARHCRIPCTNAARKSRP